MIVRALLAGILAAISVGALAQDAEVEKLLGKMREVYSGTKSARITVRISGQRFGKGYVTSEILYQKERKIRAKISAPATLGGRTRVFISDGKNVSMDDLSGHIQHGQFDLDAIPVPINLEVMSFWDWKRQLSTGPGSNMAESKFKLKKSSWNGKEWIVLGETAHGQNVYVDYFIDPKTSLIHRVQVYDIEKKQLRVETVVTKLERNIAIDPAQFKIKPKTPPKKIIF